MALREPRLANLSTGFKLFLILSLALLPLGLIAFFATLQSSRTADLENQAQMRIALTESTRKLAATIASDISATRVAMEALGDQSEDPAICARLSGIMSAQGGSAAPFAIFGPASTPICATPAFAPRRPSTLSLPATGVPRIELQNGRLEIVVGSSTSHAGVIVYSREALAAVGAPGGFTVDYALALVGPDESLTLIEYTGEPGLAGYETLSAPVGTTGLSAEMTVAREPFSAAEIVAILLPLVMWAAAAAIGWLVVDRLLIRPLRRLEREVSAYQPGEILEPIQEPTSAHELRQLGSTFHTITRMISTHEAELAEGLARQTRLTREVHHRVKNNLQVIASLINLHARGANAPDVARAYASIQRRVDALSVVHRNHYAELEESRGVELRKLVGELAQNLRASVPEGEHGPIITLDLATCYVTQDVAVPVAFLLTELIELAMSCDARARIAITLRPVDAGSARLSVCSSALIESAALDARLADRFGRVIEGLSRQLRSPLARDTRIGEFSLILATSDETPRL
ncbi:sensor histidine kinase [Sphingomonas cavernae]|uniref:histidine kinase n=1 Tax=Sphingomonas cavernae TaxID=2320861 RepID=A0A418WKK2_9SPHN|nr:sensor histidine kinase [Sphingomonas cavernae]RJF90548.1 sensor histidine kinase [Sphingomonas cavernae]